VHFIPLKPFHLNLHIFSLFYILELSYLTNWNIKKYRAKRKHRNFCHWKWRKWVSYAVKSSRLCNKLNSRTPIWFHRSTQQGKNRRVCPLFLEFLSSTFTPFEFFCNIFSCCEMDQSTFLLLVFIFFICIDIIKRVMSTDYSAYIRKFSNPIKFPNASYHPSNSMT